MPLHPDSNTPEIIKYSHIKYFMLSFQHFKLFILSSLIDLILAEEGHSNFILLHRFCFLLLVSHLEQG